MNEREGREREREWEKGEMNKRCTLYDCKNSLDFSLLSDWLNDKKKYLFSILF
jgi:hypothetical protein